MDIDPLLVALPPFLTARARVQTRLTVATSGGVGYWRHHAARVDDHAAFNVARQIADGLRLPLLVYQGLAGPHSDNNTRQHQFIADGALAVQSALALDAFGLTFEAKRMRSSFSASIGEGA